MYISLCELQLQQKSRTYNGVPWAKSTQKQEPIRIICELRALYHIKKFQKISYITVKCCSHLKGSISHKKQIQDNRPTTDFEQKRKAAIHKDIPAAKG